MTASLAAQEAQVDSLQENSIRMEAGMGISGMLTPSVWNYINTSVDIPDAQKAGGFIGTSEFFFNADVRIDSSWWIGLEYNYGLWSHSWDGGAGLWDYEEQLQMPAMSLHYLIRSNHSFLRLGGSIGYYISDLSQGLDQGQMIVYRAHGIGLKTDAVADMAFSDHVFCSLIVDIRGCVGSSFTNNGAELSYMGTTPQMSFFSAGIKFGINYQF
ncbi:MAG: hypothetical protein WAV76_00520 [Bacteroidota bacterium]